MTKSIVYVVNDTMYDFFVASQESRLQNAPDIDCYVIPFSEDFSRIRGLAKVFDFSILKANLGKWDKLGEKIWGEAPHRPNVPKKYYFRKLSMFEVPSDHFLFVDANTVFTDKIGFYIDCFINSGLDISFLSYSLPGRNFQHAGLIDLIDHLNPNIRHGFNCGFVLGKRSEDFFDTMEALSVPGKNLQRVFGGAPEQAFLSYAAALSGKKVARFIDVLPQASTETQSSSEIVDRRGVKMFGAKSKSPGKRTFFLKWNGSKISEDLPNYSILKKYLDSGNKRVADYHSSTNSFLPK